MRGKAALVLGLGVGYVLGTRDGRERYEQIKEQAVRLRNDPRVKEKAAQAQTVVQEKAPEAKQAVSDAAQKVAHRASGGDGDPGPHGDATVQPAPMPHAPEPVDPTSSLPGNDTPFSGPARD